MAKAYKIVNSYIELAPGVRVPVRKHYEFRSGYRATIGKKAVIFRIPVLSGSRVGATQNLDKQLELSQPELEIEKKLTDWVRDTYQKKPEAFARLLPISLPDSGHILVMGQKFKINISGGRAFKSHRAEIDVYNPNLVRVELTYSDHRPKAEIVDTLLSRIFADRFHSVVWQRLEELNHRFFQVHVDGLSLKNTTSVWGSCSSKGNINLSSRLLLVPQKARDSVIIHELAHRIEMNHSKRYWKLVYDAMPDYDEAHEVLKKYGRILRFIPVG
ncbi:MAG: M48 family metallopeptidase [Bacteroidota bacterium]